MLDAPLLDAGQAGPLSAALERSLCELLQYQPLYSVPASQDRLRGPPLRHHLGGPDALGRQIARSLHVGLSSAGTGPE